MFPFALRAWGSRRRESGQIVLITAALLPVMMGIGGLALDVSYLYGQRQATQSAADAAAQAGAIALAQGQAPATAVKDAQTYASSNGFPAATVTLIPPLDPDEVRVDITTSVSPILSVVLRPAGFTSSVSAVANATRVNDSSANTIMALDPNPDADTILVNGNGCLNTTGAIYDDSSSLLAIENPNNGSGNSNCPTGSTNIQGSAINVVGSAGSGCCSVTPVSNSAYSPDPLLGLILPYFSSGNWYSADGTLIGPGSLSRTGHGVKEVDTYSPGFFPQTISIQHDAVFNPGIYVLEGGLSDSGQSNITTPCVTTNPTTYQQCGGIGGVFIYNTSQTAGGCGSISLTGQGTIALSAPTSGPYQGVLLAQDRTCTNDVSIAGQSGDVLAGTVYAPSATVTLAGNAAPGTINQIIAYKISVTGNGWASAPADASHTPPTLPTSSVLIQ